ncbi:alternative oxidase [Scleroderma citrinum]
MCNNAEDLAGPKKGLAVDSEKAGMATTVHRDWVLFHPVYMPEELRAVLHCQPKSLSDKVALAPHKPLPPDDNNMYVLTEKAWLRVLFLETVAGMPGMVAASTSWRIFMTLKQPSIWFCAMVLGMQGMFSNIFFFSYLILPKTCHHFVSHLEEEAVLTYMQCIEEIEAGCLPKWKDMPAPKIAKAYWCLPDDAKLLDVIYAVHSDESTHRLTNHSLANLNPKTDVNPFTLCEPDICIPGKKVKLS